MTHPFRGGMQVHAVPDDEVAFDAQGKPLPWGYVYADNSLNRHKQPVERGPFGKSNSRRTLSRSKTATPATKDDLIRIENQKYQDEIFAKYRVEQTGKEKTIAQPSARPRAPAQSVTEDEYNHAAGLAGRKSTAPAPEPATFSEPTEVLIYGYLQSHFPSVISFYERAAFGTIYEDYEREPPPGHTSRYPHNVYVHPRFIPRNLPSEALAKISTYTGGLHWIKVTFDSPLSAERAYSASPHMIGGCDVYCVPWVGAGPAEDVALPTGHGGVAGTITGGARRVPSSKQAERTFSSLPARSHGGRGAAFADSTSSTETAGGASSSTAAGNTSDDASSNATARAAPEESSLRRREPFPSEVAASAPTRPRVRGAKVVVLRPAEEAFLPLPPWSVRTFGEWPLIGTLVVAMSGAQTQQASSSGLIGNVVPRDEHGNFDRAHASIWWMLCYWIDLWFGTDICGLKDDD